MSNKTITLTEDELSEILKMIINGHYTKQPKLYNKLDRALHKKPIKISSRKAKGRNLQHFVCERISKLTRINYKQSDDSCEIHSREMGQHGTDIILRGKALQSFPFSIECKNSETFNLAPTIEQAKENQNKDTDWMIVHKRKGWKNPIVIIDWDCFEKLYKNNKIDWSYQEKLYKVKGKKK